MSTIQNNLKEEKAKSAQSNDFFANTELVGKTPEELMDEGHDPDSFTIQPKEKYLENEKIKEHAKANNISEEELSQKYDKALQEFNKLQTIQTAATQNYMQQKLQSRQGYGAIKKENKNWDEILTPMEQAILSGHKDENGDRKNVDNFWDVAFGKDGTFRIKRQEVEGGDTAPVKNKYNFYELESIKNGEALEYDDVVLSAWNVGGAKNTFMDPNKYDEALYSTVARTVVKSIPYFIPGLNYAWAAKDLIKGGSSIGRSVARALGNDEKDFNRLNNLFARTETGHGHHDSSFSAGAIIEGVGDVVGQVKGMSLTFKGSANIAKALGAGPKAATRIGQVAGRLQMSLPASSDIAKLAEHNGISPEHTLLIHALTTAGYMSIGGLTEKLFMPAERAAILNNSTKKFVNNMMKKGYKNSFEWNGAKNIAQTMVNNGKAALERMAALKVNKPAVYKALLGSFNEGLEESLETGMEESIKQMYNTWQKDKKAGKGRFQNFDAGEFVKEAGTSFFYGALAGGLLGSKIGQKHILGRQQSEMDQENFEDFVMMAENVETRGGMDKFIEDENNFKQVSDKITFKVDENGQYMAPDFESSDPALNVTQRKAVHSILKADWEYAKSLVDAGALGALHEEGRFTPEVKAKYEKFVEANRGLLLGQATKHLSEIEKVKGEIEDLKKNQPENYAEAVKEKQSLINEKQNEINDLYKKENIEKLTEEAIYLYAPDVNVNNEGEKIFEGDSGFLSFERYKELNANYRENISKLQEEAAAAKATEKQILNTPDIQEKIELASSNTVTPEAIEHIHKELNTQIDGAASQYKETATQVARELYGEEGVEEFSQDQLLSLQSYDNIDVPEYRAALESNPSIQEALNTYNSVNKVKSEFKPNATVDSDANTILQQAHALDSDGQDIATQVSEEIAMYKTNPEEYTSLKPEKLIDEIKQHINFLNTYMGFFDALNTYKKLNNQKALDPEEAKEHFNKYKLVQENLVQLHNSLVEAQNKSASNRNNVIETMNSKNKEVLNERAKTINETLSTYFSDPAFQGLRDELQTHILEVQDENTSFEEAYVKMRQIETVLYDAFNSLNVQDQLKVLKNFNIKDSGIFTKPAQRLNLFRSIVAVKGSDFLSEFYSIVEDSDSVPTYEQELNIQEVFAGILSNYNYHGSQSPFESVLHHHAELRHATDIEHLKNSIFIQGSAGAGKTSFIVGTAIKMLNSYAEENNLSSTKFKTVVASGPGVPQQNNLKSNLESNEIELATDKEINADTLLKDLENQEGYLSDAGTIVFDEATWIPTETLQKINKALETYNTTVRKDTLPLQILYVGDPAQLGNFKRTEDGGIQEDNISKYSSKISTTYVNMSMRSKNEPLSAINKGHIQKRLDKKLTSNQELIENQKFEGKWGKDANDRYAGVRVLSGDNTEVEEAMAQLLNQPHTTFAYITDKPLTEIPEKARQYALSPDEIQGQEFDAVVVDLRNEVMEHKGKQVTSEELSLKTIGVSVGRAREMAVIVNRTNRNWSSTRSNETIKETFSLLNAENINKITPVRKQQLKIALEVLSDANAMSSFDISSAVEEIDIVSIEALKDHMGPIFEQSFQEKFQDDLNDIQQVLADSIEELDEDDPEYAKKRKEKQKEAQQQVDKLIKEYQVEFDVQVNEEWAEVEEQIKEVEKNQEPTPIEERTTNNGVLSEESYESAQIIESLPKDSLILRISDLDDIISSSMSLNRGATKQPNQDLDPTPDNSNLNETESEEETNLESPKIEGIQVTYTPKGQKEQVYTIKETKIFNKNGKEVYNEDGVHRNKIFANLAVKEGRAKVLSYKNDKYVVSKNGKIMSTKTGKIMQWDDNHPARKYLLKESGYFVIPTPEKGEISEDEQSKALDNAFKSSEEFMKDSLKNGEIPAHTWIAHDPSGNLSKEEIHNIKKDIFDGKDLKKYKFTLQVADITEITDPEIKIIYPDKLLEKSGGKIVYVQASWGDNKIALATLPYVSDQRLMKNSKYDIINNFINNPEFAGLDITDIVKSYWGNSANRKLGRAYTQNSNIPLAQTIEASPHVSFSNRIFNITQSWKAGKKYRNKPFILYSYRSQEELNKFIDAFINTKDVDLNDLSKFGIGLIMLNNKSFKSISELTNFFAEENKNPKRKVRSEKLLSPNVLKAIINTMKDEYPSMSSQQKTLIKNIFSEIGLVDENRSDIDINISDDSISFSKDLSEVKYVNLDLLTLHKHLQNLDEQTIKWFDDLINSTKKLGTNSKLFSQGIMLNSNYSSTEKIKAHDRELAIIQPAFNPTSNGPNALLNDEVLLSLYSTNVHQISTPDMIMTKSMVDKIVSKISQKVESPKKKATNKRIIAQNERNKVFKDLQSKVHEIVNNPIVPAEMLDQFQEKVNSSILTNEKKQLLIKQLSSKRKNMKDPIKIPHLPVQLKVIETTVKNTPEMIVSEDKDSGAKDIMKIVNDIVKMDSENDTIAIIQAQEELSELYKDVNKLNDLINELKYC